MQISLDEVAIAKYIVWLQTLLNYALSHLARYGFELNNREKAVLVWAFLFVVWALTLTEVRSGLIRTLKTAIFSKLIVIWIVYVLWIFLFIYISDYVGIWRTFFVKDTLVWGATSGLVVLAGFNNAAEPGYFVNKLTQIVGLVVIFEYMINFAPFSFWIELFLQPILAFVAIPPSVLNENQAQKTWQGVRAVLSMVLLIAIVGNTVFTFYVSWETINWRLFGLKAVWPMFLGIWVLTLVFPIATYATYEEAFIQLRLHRENRLRRWKTKLGIILAFRLRLNLIRNLTKNATKYSVTSDSFISAYESAKQCKSELS